MIDPQLRKTEKLLRKAIDAHQKRYDEVCANLEFDGSPLSAEQARRHFKEAQDMMRDLLKATWSDYRGGKKSKAATASIFLGMATMLKRNETFLTVQTGQQTSGVM